jgi:hypothetical protein
VEKSAIRTGEGRKVTLANPNRTRLIAYPGGAASRLLPPAVALRAAAGLPADLRGRRVRLGLVSDVATPEEACPDYLKLRAKALIMDTISPRCSLP